MGMMFRIITIYILISLVFVSLSVHATYICDHSEFGNCSIHCTKHHKSNEHVLNFSISIDNHNCCEAKIKFNSDIVDILPSSEASATDPPSSASAMDHGIIKNQTAPKLLLLNSYSKHYASDAGTITYLATHRIRI